MPHETTTTTSGAPFAKLVEIGSTFVGAFAGSTTRQRTKYGSQTNELLFKADGKPLQEEVMHFVAMPGSTAVTGNVEKGETAPIQPGDHVRFAVSGFKWGQIIDQRKKLPAAHGISAGRQASSDVYTIRLVGYSVTTDNAEGAKAAGFTVVDGRIIMRSSDEHERWVLNQVKKGANATAGKDYEITVRRADASTEAAWMTKADDLWDTKPWERATEPVVHAHAAAGPFDDNDEPF